MKVKKLFNYFPSLVNWNLGNQTPFLQFLKSKYPTSDYPLNTFEYSNIQGERIDSKYQIKLLPCSLSPYDVSNLLEVVNLAINRLGNLHID